MEIPEENKKRLLKLVSVFLIILSVYFVVKIFTQIRSPYMFRGSVAPATISFSGHGEVTAVPDIANFYLTIRKEAKTTKQASELAAEVEKKLLDFLKSKNIEDKDIQATNISSYPKYDYVRTSCLESMSYNCGGKQVLTGYEASESITVKIRNVDDIGAILQGLGTVGLAELSGPNFAIDKEDTLKAEARKKAIDNAREKAKVLAKDLGVKLGKISSFSEGGNYYPMYGKAEMMDASVSSAPAPAVIPKGENTISSDVTITYEIR